MVCSSVTVCGPLQSFVADKNLLLAKISVVTAYGQKNKGCFIMFCMITNIYNKKTKGPTLMEFFTATGKLKKFFLTTRDVRCVHQG
jgi:hypothetical protein